MVPLSEPGVPEISKSAEGGGGIPAVRDQSSIDGDRARELEFSGDGLALCGDMEAFFLGVRRVHIMRIIALHVGHHGKTRGIQNHWNMKIDGGGQSQLVR